MKENKQLLLVEDDLYSAETLKFALEQKATKSLWQQMEKTH
ncbi:MAG: hypothetical protein SCABRO_00281 [Candidatus Scalindua brodae]|uniref:Uncharacterized protein n=1 Tax=Candidatus Scalindua brodae TaxID=237368 RepID=A0A0B0EQ38_9BACT|nr:MAG: hypothetical protein SCABRO_00281 [Candidatus Scalindua brodae]